MSNNEFFGGMDQDTGLLKGTINNKGLNPITKLSPEILEKLQDELTSQELAKAFSIYYNPMSMFSNEEDTSW